MYFAPFAGWEMLRKHSRFVDKSRGAAAVANPSFLHFSVVFFLLICFFRLFMLCSGASCHHVNVPSCATSDATWRHPGSLRRAGPLKSSSNPRAKIVPTKPPRSNCRSTTTGTSAVLLAYNARAMAGSLGRNRMQTNEVTCGTSNFNPRVLKYVYII